LKVFAAVVCLAAASPVVAAPESPAAVVPAPPAPSAFEKAIDEMMVALAPQSLQASTKIRETYAPQLDLLMLDEYAELEGALESGRLAPLPMDPTRFNLVPRLEGPNPIGEMDMDRQRSYIAARAAAVASPTVTKVVAPASRARRT